MSGITALGCEVTVARPGSGFVGAPHQGRRQAEWAGLRSSI